MNQNASLPDDPVTIYARAVTKGEIVAGPYVRAACARHIKDIETGAQRGLTFDPAAVAKVVRFFHALTIEVEERETDGSVKSKVAAFDLQPWQVFIVGSLFGWKNADGLRRFRRAYVEAAKGSGKTPCASGVAMYFLCGKGVNKERGEVYSAATSREQATILFRDAIAMWRRSPGLRKRLTTKGKQTQTISQLTHIKTDSIFRPVSAENKGQSGLRPYCAVIDEVHEHPDNTVIEMMRAGTKGNQEALILEITNAGFDKRTVCGQEHDYSVQVVTGEVQNDAWFAYICALDTGTTETFGIDDAVRRMDDSCTCSAKTIPTSHQELATAFASAVTSALAASEISKTGKLAPTTLTAMFSGAVSVMLATSGGSTALTPNIEKNELPRPSRGTKSTGTVLTAQIDAGPPEKNKPTQNIFSNSTASENTGSLPSLSEGSKNIRGQDVRYVGAPSLSGLITATLRERLADSSAINVTLDSVCSEIVSRLFARHSNTCKVHQRYSLNHGKICEQFPADDPFQDEKCWIKANPNLGVSIHPAYIREQVQEAKGMPSKEGTVRRLNFCQWTDSENQAIPRELWEACEAKVDTEQMVESGYRCFGGLDLSRVGDLTAFTLNWLVDETKDKWVFAAKTWFWSPKDTLLERSRKDRAPYDVWAKQGHLEAVPGKLIKFPWIADALLELCAKYNPESIGCDQYGLTQLLDQLADAGGDLPCVVHPQGFNKRVVGERDGMKSSGAEEIILWMPDSINKLEAALLEKRITVDLNPVMRMCSQAVVYATNRTGHRMFDKERATRRIDGMVSLAMSIGVATTKDARVNLNEFLANAVMR